MQVRAGWEALLARQPDMRESRKVADALRALVKSRLQGAEGAQAAVLGKRTIDRPHGNFVMLKVGRAGACVLALALLWTASAVQG